MRLRLAAGSEPAVRDVPRVVMVGGFDPVIAIHAQSLGQCRDRAVAARRRTAIVCIHPPIEELVCHSRPPPQIHSVEARLRFLRAFGEVWFLSMTPAEAEALGVEALVAQLAARFPIGELVIGQFQSFGRGERGNHAAITAAARARGFAVVTLPGAAVTSATVRGQWARGELDAALAALAFPPAAVIRRGGPAPFLGLPDGRYAFEVDDGSTRYFQIRDGFVNARPPAGRARATLRVIAAAP